MAWLRPVQQVYRFAAGKLLEQLLGEERRERCQDHAETDQHIMERAVGLGLVGVVIGLPETFTAASDVPVAGVIDERQDGLEGVGQVVALHMSVDLLAELMQTTDDPEVERILELGRRIRRQLTFGQSAIPSV